MKDTLNDEFQIFTDNNIKDLKEIIIIPNDNYTCTECNLVPKILKIDYSTGTIEFECKIHHIKKMFLKNYLLKMSKHIYFNKKCDFCQKVQNESQGSIFDYCLYCKKIICQDCKKKHNHLQILKLNDLDNKCLKHHNKLYEYFCFKCNENYCCECKEHEEHGENASSYDFLPSTEIDTLTKCNNLFKKEMKILPYLIKINDILITSQAKYTFNYFHNTNLRVASNSFLETDLFLNQINEYKEKLNKNKPIISSFVHPLSQAQKIIKNVQKDIEEQKKLLKEFNELYKTTLDGNEINIELNNKNIGDSGLKLLSKIKFKRCEKIKLKGNNLKEIEPLVRLCNKKITKIDLSFNNITGLNSMKDPNCDLGGLQKLYLNNNKIEDISIFGMKDIFPQLKVLNICNNRINFDLKETQKLLETIKDRLLIFKYKDINNLYFIINFSSVLTKKEDIDFLNERFKKINNIDQINYNLIYRGTRDGDRASDFHNKCDPYSKTLCVIKSQNAIFGGYTEATWDGVNEDKFDENAFCFRLTGEKKIYEKVEGENAIGANVEYGPIFRYTFHLNDSYFSKKAFCYAKYSHFNSGSQHELTGGDKFPVVVECEVFHITFD